MCVVQGLSGWKALPAVPGAGRGRSVWGSLWTPSILGAATLLPLPCLSLTQTVSAGVVMAEGRRPGPICRLPKSLPPPECQGKEPCFLVSSCGHQQQEPLQPRPGAVATSSTDTREAGRPSLPVTGLAWRPRPVGAAEAEKRPCPGTSP